MHEEILVDVLDYLQFFQDKVEWHLAKKEYSKALLYVNRINVIREIAIVETMSTN